MPLKICFTYYSIVFLALANVLAKTESAKICGWVSMKRLAMSSSGPKGAMILYIVLAPVFFLFYLLILVL